MPVAVAPQTATTAMPTATSMACRSHCNTTSSLRSHLFLARCRAQCEPMRPRCSPRAAAPPANTIREPQLAHSVAPASARHLRPPNAAGTPLGPHHHGRHRSKPPGSASRAPTRSFIAAPHSSRPQPHPPAPGLHRRTSNRGRRSSQPAAMSEPRPAASAPKRGTAPRRHLHRACTSFAGTALRRRRCRGGRGKVLAAAASRVPPSRPRWATRGSRGSVFATI